MSNLIEIFREEHNLHFNDMSGGDYNFQYIEWLEKKFDKSVKETNQEEISTLIQDALHATGRISVEQCDQLTSGMLEYINQAGFRIVKN